MSSMSFGCTNVMLTVSYDRALNSVLEPMNDVLPPLETLVVVIKDLSTLMVSAGVYWVTGQISER